jgi:NAD+ synthase (glutamine-hydrolysing)
MKITLAQLNPTVGDIEGNLAQIKETISKFSKVSDLIVFPELFITGYPPRDLLEKKIFIEKAQSAVQELAKSSSKHPKTGIILGTPALTGKSTGKGLYNSALLIHKGRILFKQHKSLLPTYDVFDEARYFDSASEVQIIQFKGSALGISICEDAWNEPELWPKGRMYPVDPIEELAKKGASIFINISASPFYMGKEELRYHIIKNHAQKHGCPFVYVNAVGGNDELIFDGGSICVDREGKPIRIFPSFKEHVQTIDMKTSGNPSLWIPPDKSESVYEAIILGIRDYMRKCGFSKAVIGLSGGIDSAVTACLAKEAIGSENVLGISMPSLFSSKESLEYAKRLAKNLGIQLKVIPISSIYHSYIQSLRKQLGVGKDIDVTLENIQARIRGNILMAYSNKFGYLVLSTGNKSELAMGYCTLYGDMTGGLAVISDVPKTMVYELARFINRKSEVIPSEIIERKPSAELRPDQCDQDTLPPYEILDQILFYYIEKGYSLEDLLKLKHDPKTVGWIIRTVNKNEYKRRQAPPGLKVTSKAFGMGRRMPIAAKYGR